MTSEIESSRCDVVLFFSRKSGQVVMIQKRTFISFIVISTISFILHFIWEWFQCGPFFIHRGTQASLISMVLASLGDLILTFFIIGLAPFLGRFDRSLKALKTIQGFILIEIVAFATAVAVEKVALATNRWSYTEINPLLPLLEVSVLPILQLMLLTPAIVFASPPLVNLLMEKKHFK